MIITLVSPTGLSDYGSSVEITDDFVYLDQPDPNYNYIKSKQGVFRRSINYWDRSPYGWRRVLPNHVNKWGLQDD